MSLQEKFLEASEKVAFDEAHRQKINFNISRYNNSVAQGKQQYQDLELARKRAAFTKWKVLENLDKYLLEFESHLGQHGGKVIWAPDQESALQEIDQIMKRYQAKTVVKSKSMITEEIGLNEFLEKRKIETVETDLGEYIVQLANEKPYHIVTPAMHKSKEDVAELFHEKLGTDISATPEELTLEARRKLRSKYTSAQVGITGANFLIAESGGVAITENEGNARLSFGFPKVHIVIAGIEKVIPSINDLDLFWPLLSTMGTGQKLTVYNSIIHGPRHLDEKDGPEEMYVILLDNGRTRLLGKERQRQALSCIRCGACLNACPVYKNIGGHSYNTTYSGPIGSVITPHQAGLPAYKHLSYASSLCGNCTEVCPVKIDLHNLLLFNRKDAVEEKLTKAPERLTWYLWKRAMLNRKHMNGGSGLKNLFLGTLFKKQWGQRRELPKMAPKSFNELWREQH